VKKEWRKLKREKLEKLFEPSEGVELVDEEDLLKVRRKEIDDTEELNEGAEKTEDLEGNKPEKGREHV
jgi:hypothetical protein